VKAFLDACVLFPTVMREMLMGVAAKGLFEPQFSPRVLEEWARAANRIGPTGEAQARAEIAMLRANWPKAEVSPTPALEARLWLPDENDIHVLAAAIAGSADGIITMNAKDFPRDTLAEEGVSRFDPDGFLVAMHGEDPVAVQEVGDRVLEQARAMSSDDWHMRALMKKARLPRLGKALSA
jgi:predicted nucleic acid-binding protein